LIGICSKGALHLGVVIIQLNGLQLPNKRVNKVHCTFGGLMDGMFFGDRCELVNH
jgi:hypothetical protein